MDDWEKFEKNYGHALRVWRKIGMKDLGDYHSLCLKMDVLLFSNVFKTFKATCLDYTLNPAHFYTSPRLAWQASLKKTKVLEVASYTQVNNKYMGDLILGKRVFPLSTWMPITCMVGQ